MQTMQTMQTPQTRHPLPEPFQLGHMLVETEDGVSRRIGAAWTYFKRWTSQNH
ncbi:hypothetical protein BP00DRAFT_422138 [Aspergillus indologenus CBS 114.80]|uniref:Uncharacterized protein n=1 Tax=Aspergillus indologenus CBS 114.80 TaxID=1450541 RepID=A0A2V5INT8_9EURO|nr:hypothetical protein BP00DRAFT_422138 [Aspergillus indologenus CBS 114.80]